MVSIDPSHPPFQAGRTNGCRCRGQPKGRSSAVKTLLITLRANLRVRAKRITVKRAFPPCATHAHRSSRLPHASMKISPSHRSQDWSGDGVTRGNVLLTASARLRVISTFSDRRFVERSETPGQLWCVPCSEHYLKSPLVWSKD